MKKPLLIGCGVVAILALVVVFLVAFGTVTQVRGDLRNAFGVPPANVVGYDDLAEDTVRTLEAEPNGVRSRYLAIEAAHVQRRIVDVPHRIHEVEARAFPDELTRLETDLWRRLAETNSPDTVDVLRRGHFEHDVFPLGRAAIRFRYESDGKTTQLSIDSDDRSHASTRTGSPSFDPELDRILGR